MRYKKDSISIKYDTFESVDHRVKELKEKGAVNFTFDVEYDCDVYNVILEYQIPMTEEEIREADEIQAQRDWDQVRAMRPEPIRCPERLKNGGTCPHHNLHCGWPACNKETP